MVKSAAAAAPTLTNDTIRQRILIGGSQPLAASHRGLAKAACHFHHLTTALQSDTSDEVEVAATALRSELALHDLEMRKLFLTTRAYDAASSKSKASLSTMTSSQTSIQSDIETLTAALNHEKKIRKNREEYNTLAKMINASHPPAKKTREDLKRVQEEISRTTEEVERAQWEIGIREKQVRLFMTSLGDLREVLRDEDWRKEAVATSDESAEPDAEKNPGDRMDTDDAGVL